MLHHTGLYLAQTLGLEGRKHQAEDHTHFIVTLQFYDSQEAIDHKLGLFLEDSLALVSVKPIK